MERLNARFQWRNSVIVLCCGIMANELETKRESWRAASMTYRQRHPDLVAAMKADWYQRNKEQRRAVQKAYRDALRSMGHEVAVMALEGIGV